MGRREIILLFWDCPCCGHKHIPGPTRRCPRCFWWRDRTVKFYEAPDSVVLSPAEVARYAGPDWICKVCGAANPETGAPRESLVCGNCHTRQVDVDGGSTSLETLPVGVVVARPSSRPEAYSSRRYTGRVVSPMSGGSGREIAADISGGSMREIGADRPRSILSTVYILATVGLVGLGIAGLNTLIHLVTLPRPVNALVLRRHWRVEVPIEERRPVTEGDWTLPEGAYHVRTEKRQKSTRKIQIGTEKRTVQVPYKVKVGTRTECETVSRGDGTGERVCSEEPVYETRYRTETEEKPIYREEPVYATWYSYTIDRWRPLRTEVAEGTEDTPRRPPGLQLATHPYPQRQLTPKETCFLDVQARNRHHTWTIACATYDRILSNRAYTFLKRPGVNEVSLAPSR